MMKKDNRVFLYVHYVSEGSYVNGPGKRTVVWTQGCYLRCKGCFNPITHSAISNGTYFDVELLASKLSNLKVCGLAISGGEPLEQSDALLRLLQFYKKKCSGNILSVIPGKVYTTLKFLGAMLRKKAYKLLKHWEFSVDTSIKIL